MITTEIFVYYCAFNHSFTQNFFFFNESYFYSRSFQKINIQALLWKIQGLFKDIPQFFNFQGLFKTCVNHV